MQAHRRSPSGAASQALQRTVIPGVYRRGESYVAIWRAGGRQRKTTFATLHEAQRAKVMHDRGERVPTSSRFGQYAAEWIETYRGRTRRGLARSTRADYRRSL